MTKCSFRDPAAAAARACRRRRLVAPLLGLAALMYGLALGAAPLDDAVTALARDRNRPPEPMIAALDELAPQLENAPLDTRRKADATRTIALMELGRLDESGQVVKRLIDAGRREQNPRAVLHGQLLEVLVWLQQGRINDAMATTRQLLLQRGNTGDPELEIQLLRVAGNAFNRAAKYEEAARFYHDAIALADAQRRSDLVPSLMNGLANVNIGLRSYAKALEYATRGQALAEKQNDKFSLASISVNLGYIHSELNQAALELVAHQKALKLARELGSINIEGTTLTNLSDYHLRRKEWRQAATYAREALALGNKVGDRSLAAISQANLGYALTGQGEHNVGIHHFEGALKTFESMEEKEQVVGLLPELADVYELAGRLTDALAAMRRYKVESEQLYQKDRDKVVADLQERFDAERRQREIDLLTKDNGLKSAEIETKRLQQQVWGLVAAVLGLLVMLALQLYWRVRQANRELSAVNQKLEFHSSRDPLTGLYNRRSLQLHLDRVIAQRRSAGVVEPAMGVMLLDIDHFKHINDTWGHAAGDAVLVEIGRRLTRMLRDDDMVVRWGGEEFLVLLPAITEAGLATLTTRVLAVVGDSPIEFGGHLIPVNTSIGACPFPIVPAGARAYDWEKHVQLADSALYMAKVNGRNRCYHIQALLGDNNHLLDDAEGNLQEAIANGEVRYAVVEGPPAYEHERSERRVPAPPPVGQTG